MTYLVPHGGCPGSIFYQETFSPLFCCRFVFLFRHYDMFIFCCSLKDMVVANVNYTHVLRQRKPPPRRLTLTDIDLRLESGSACLPDRSKNVVDSLHCQCQLFRRVSWKSAGDCMRNAKISYFALVNEVVKWSAVSETELPSKIKQFFRLVGLVIITSFSIKSADYFYSNPIHRMTDKKRHQSHDFLEENNKDIGVMIWTSVKHFFGRRKPEIIKVEPYLELL